MFSHRFQRTVRLTHHAQQRMRERDISEERLLDLIETGTVKHKDEQRLWIFKVYPSRADNQLCAAVRLTDDALIVKTVMHHFQPEP